MLREWTVNVAKLTMGAFHNTKESTIKSTFMLRLRNSPAHTCWFLLRKTNEIERLSGLMEDSAWTKWENKREMQNTVINKNKRKGGREGVREKQLTAKTVKRFPSSTFCPCLCGSLLCHLSVISQAKLYAFFRILHAPFPWIVSHLAHAIHFFPISDWKRTRVCSVYWNFNISISARVPIVKGFRNELSFECTALDFDRVGICCCENNLYALPL